MTITIEDGYESISFYDGYIDISDGKFNENSRIRESVPYMGITRRRLTHEQVIIEIFKFKSAKIKQ